MEIKDELCYWIKQIQEALTVSAPNTLKLQKADQRVNGEYGLQKEAEHKGRLTCVLARCAKSCRSG